MTSCCLSCMIDTRSNKEKKPDIVDIQKFNSFLFKLELPGVRSRCRTRVSIPVEVSFRRIVCIITNVYALEITNRLRTTAVLHLNVIKCN